MDRRLKAMTKRNRKRRNGTGYAISTAAVRKAQEKPTQARQVSPALPAAVPRVRVKRGKR